jgi:hypothetical protein
MRSSCFTTVISCQIGGKKSSLGQRAVQFKELYAHLCGKRIVTFLGSKPVSRLRLPIELDGARILSVDSGRPWQRFNQTVTHPLHAWRKIKRLCPAASALSVD